MKTLIFFLIIASFIQTTILPVDFVLLILISRAYLKSDKANLYLAFAFGLLVGFLNLSNLGFVSLIYLLIVTGTRILSKLRLAGNPLLIVPVSFGFLSLIHITDFRFSAVLLSSLLSLPILYLIRLWEERFVVQKEIKLKIK